jgi:hypothetical protein
LLLAVVATSAVAAAAANAAAAAVAAAPVLLWMMDGELGCSTETYGDHLLHHTDGTNVGNSKPGI